MIQDSPKNSTFELVLCTRKPDKKINVLGESQWIPGDATGTKSFATDDAGKLADFMERNIGRKKHRRKSKTGEKKESNLTEKNVGRTVVSSPEGSEAA